MTDNPARNCKEWNWKSRFKTLEDATDFLLNYLADLAPYTKEAMKRLEKKERIIETLLTENNSLKQNLKEAITNEKRRKRKT